MSSEFSNLVLWSTYCDRLPNIYGSAGSREWGLRQIKAKAVAAGALVLVRGRWYANPSLLDQVHMDEAKASAARHAESWGAAA